MKVVFVCLGNICRSPAAEGVFLDLLVKKNLTDHYVVDSAGTGSWHVGELPDARMREHAKKRGIDLKSRSRQFKPEDFDLFDYIVVMDKSNYQNVTALTKKDENIEKVVEMASYAKSHDENEVPDPYYGGDQGFEKVLDMVTEGCEELLSELEQKRNQR
jgi:protein-tyrosine phosphatase